MSKRGLGAVAMCRGRSCRLLAWGLFAVWCLSACASSVKVRVESVPNTNNGRPFYLMARNVDTREFLAEDYESAAERLFKFPADPTVSGNETIFPGRQVTVDVQTEAGKDVILYFFFTRPGPKWKVPLRRPLPSEVVIELGRAQVKRVLVRKR
jgi:hypothetical protein